MRRKILRCKAVIPLAQVKVLNQVLLGCQAVRMSASLGDICRKHRLVKYTSPKEFLQGSRIRCHSGRLTQEATALEDIYLFECKFYVL